MTGRLCNWSKAEYEADTSRERWSRLKWFLAPHGAADYYHAWVLGDQPEATKEKPEFVLGRLFDELLLEGRGNWYVWEGVRNPRHKAYQAALEAAEGRPILKPEEEAALLSWRDAAMANEKFRQFIEGPRFSQQVILWEESIDGIAIPCKCAIDLWSLNCLADVKTTKAKTWRQYRYDMRDYGYVDQAAFYLRGRRQSLPELAESGCAFWHVIVQKGPPAFAYAKQIHSAWLRSAGQKVQWCLEQLAACRQREAEGLSGYDAWPDAMNDDEMLVEEHWMQPGDPNDYDPS